jgi:hypothetical protein
MMTHSRISRWLAASALVAALASLTWLACSESDTIGPGDGRTHPPPIADLAMTYPAVGGTVFMSWTVPRVGDESDTVNRYEIRYSYSHPLTWDLALPVSDPPAPAPGGKLQSYEFTEPRRGRDLYAAVRSFDADDNASPVGNVAHVHITGMSLEGRCTDALSSATLEGLQIQVTDRRVHNMASDSDGRYQVGDLSAGVVHVALRSGTTAKRYHNNDRTLDLAKDESLDHFMIEYIPTELQVGGNVLSLFLQAVGYNNYRRVLMKWKSYPIDVFVPPYSTSDVDYEDVCRRAVDHWNERVGSILFQLVGAEPETGVWFQFKSRQEMAPHLGITHHENDGAGFPKTSDISMVDDIVDPDFLWKVALHELGHTIRLGHLPQGYLMDAMQPQPMTVTNDEVMVVKLYLALPNGSDLSFYDSSVPE